MSAYDKFRLELPNGDVFIASGNLSITESQQPFYLLDGFQSLRTLGEIAGLVENDTSQAFLGSGARVRVWNIELTSWEGSTESWGDADPDDDVLTKLNVLGQSLATAGIDGESTAQIQFGEYSTDGKYSPQNVVPGEISLPADFGPDGSPSTLRPSMSWRDAADMTNAIHERKP